MAKPMSGKVVLITGGSSGIGRAAALLFARAEASVVLAARRADRGEKVEQEISATGARALFVQADVSDSSQVQALIARAVDRFGRLDCAFNNAAVLNKAARTGYYDEDDFNAEVSSNLKSVWLSMKYELEQMQKQQPPGGAIVNNLLGERTRRCCQAGESTYYGRNWFCAFKNSVSQQMNPPAWVTGRTAGTLRSIPPSVSAAFCYQASLTMSLSVK